MSSLPLAVFSPLPLWQPANSSFHLQRLAIDLELEGVILVEAASKQVPFPDQAESLLKVVEDHDGVYPLRTNDGALEVASAAGQVWVSTEQPWMTGMKESSHEA